MAGLNIELPKWTAMTVMGERVTRAQAAEILIRTNDWVSSCNDQEWMAAVWRAIDADVTLVNNRPQVSLSSLQAATERLRALGLTYLHNERIMSAWFGGPHGWCDWSGNLHTTNYNIGKWPSVAEVRADWKAIAEAFPFLRLRCQLWSGEASAKEIAPLVEFVVARGKVRVIVPKAPLLHPSSVGVDVLRAFNPKEGSFRGCSEQVLKWAIETTAGNLPRPSVWDRLVSEETL